MPKPSVNVIPPAIPMDQAMAGILALLVAEREDRLNPPDFPRKTEVILAAAGLAIGPIALLTGKTYEAVQKGLSRAKLKGTKASKGTST
jgi:hypothetical protein